MTEVEEEVDDGVFGADASAFEVTAGGLLFTLTSRLL